MKAAVEHLTQQKVQLVIDKELWGDQALVSQGDWLQQRQGKDLCLRRNDAMTSPADLGTKILQGRPARMRLYLLSFEDDDGELDLELKSSTAASQIAKKLTRLTLGALLADVACLESGCG